MTIIATGFDEKANVRPETVSEQAAAANQGAETVTVTVDGPAAETPTPAPERAALFDSRNEASAESGRDSDGGRATEEAGSSAYSARHRLGNDGLFTSRGVERGEVRDSRGDDLDVPDFLR